MLPASVFSSLFLASSYFRILASREGCVVYLNLERWVELFGRVKRVASVIGPDIVLLARP